MLSLICVKSQLGYNLGAHVGNKSTVDGIDGRRVEVVFVV